MSLKVGDNYNDLSLRVWCAGWSTQDKERRQERLRYGALRTRTIARGNYTRPALSALRGRPIPRSMP
jgi:hypothetical protein